MNQVPAQFKVPALPQVNLVPPEVGERRQRSRRRGAGVFFLVVFLLFLAALYGLIWFQKQEATEAAEAETAHTAELQAQIAEYAEVDVVKAQLTNANSARQYAAGLEIFWPLMISALNAGMPDGVDVDTYIFNMPPYGQTPAVSGTPFGRSPIASVSFTARITSPGQAAAIEDQLNTIPFLERARVTTMRLDDTSAGVGETPQDGGEGVVVWIVDGTVDVNYDALMMRYSSLWFGDDGAESLEAYYRSYFEGLIAGQGIPPGYPPLPPATPPPFVPGQFGQGGAAIPEPAPSPAPSEEVAQ